MRKPEATCILYSTLFYNGFWTAVYGLNAHTTRKRGVLTLYPVKNFELITE